MRFLFLLISLLIISCGHHKSKSTINPLTEVQAIRDFYAANISLNDKEIFRKRCDKLTFAATFSAFGIKQDLSSFQENGKYSRDDEFPCFPDDLDGNGEPDSKSSISADPYIMLMHNWLTNTEYEAVDTAIKYAEANNYTVGEGPFDLVNITHIMYFMYKVRDAVTPEEKAELIDIVDQQFKGFRGHLLLSLVWLNARLNGETGHTGLSMLKKLVEEEPTNLMFSAMYNRYTTGNQSAVIDAILNNKFFPKDRVPTDDGNFGWGSCPDAVYLIMLTAILEGK